MAKRLFLTFVHASFLLAILVGSAQADLNLANGTASGQWYNPARDGEGFYVEVIGEGDNLQIAVAMYSYNAQGEQLWLVGNVAIAAGDIGATVPVVLIEGPVWGTGYDPADKDTTQFGTIVVRFPTCDSALFNVNSNVQGLESGDYSLVRLTELVGMDCTDSPPKPDGMVTSGLWTGTDLCFFVNTEGTKIVESDLCDNGKSFWASIPGNQISNDGNIADDCTANVACGLDWEINYGDEASVTCVNLLGGIGVIRFDSATHATVETYETTDQDGYSCVGFITDAKPAE